MSALVEGKYFAVRPIVKLIGIDDSDMHTHLLTKTCDIKEGLAIEKDNYVINYIKPSKTGLELEDIDFRLVDLIDEKMSMEDFWEMMQEYKNCVEL